MDEKTNRRCSSGQRRGRFSLREKNGSLKRSPSQSSIEGVLSGAKTTMCGTLNDSTPSAELADVAEPQSVKRLVL